MYGLLSKLQRRSHFNEKTRMTSCSHQSSLHIRRFFYVLFSKICRFLTIQRPFAQKRVKKDI